MRNFLRDYLFAVCAALAMGAPALAQNKLMTVGTGGVTGVYYAAGGAMCRLVNRDRASTGIRCLVESTQGSRANVDALSRGAVNFALVQSDVQYHALKGDAVFAGAGAQENLRSVFGLYNEVFTALAAADVPAKELVELKGRRVSLGLPSSGSRATVDELLQVYGLTPADFMAVTERISDEQGYALCEKKVDAALYVVGHPVPHITRTMKDCNARLVPMLDAWRDKAVQARPYFVKTDIPAGAYAGMVGPVPTIGLVATVTTNASTPDALVYALVKAVFNNLEQLKTSHPALAQLDVKSMLSQGLSAPLHPAALKYYKEKGWL